MLGFSLTLLKIQIVNKEIQNTIVAQMILLTFLLSLCPEEGPEGVEGVGLLQGLSEVVGNTRPQVRSQGTRKIKKKKYWPKETKTQKDEKSTKTENNLRQCSFSLKVHIVKKQKSQDKKQDLNVKKKILENL